MNVESAVVSLPLDKGDNPQRTFELGTEFIVRTTWQGFCREEHGFDMIPMGDPPRSTSCDEVLYDAVIECVGGPCKIESNKPLETEFIVTPAQPGAIAIVLTYKPKDKSKPKKLELDLTITPAAPE
jgi:hypothetical protein